MSDAPSSYGGLARWYDPIHEARGKHDVVICRFSAIGHVAAAAGLDAGLAAGRGLMVGRGAA